MGTIRRQYRGFTLIELMIVVAIIGILAATAIPSFMKYIRRSKTTEALMNIRAMYDSAVVYYSNEQVDTLGNQQPRQFPPDSSLYGGWTPPPGTCCASVGQKCAPNPNYWLRPDWQTLNFGIDDPHYYIYYSYRYSGPGTSPGNIWWAYALGDLNCNGTWGQYWRTATVSSDYALRGGSGVSIINDLE